MKASAEVDPETGEVLEVNVPWWAFLVTPVDVECQIGCVCDEEGNTIECGGPIESNDTNITIGNGTESSNITVGNNTETNSTNSSA